MRFLCILVVLALMPVLSNASTLSFEFIATLKSQTIYSRQSGSLTDAPPLTGAFSELPVGSSLQGVAHLTYDAEKVKGELPELWRVRGSCSLGGVDCGFGGDAVFKDPRALTNFFDTGEGAFTFTDDRDGTMFEIGPSRSSLTYMGTASDWNSPYVAIFDLEDLLITSDAVRPRLAAGLAAVPLPAGLPLLLGGLAAFWAFRRRKVS